MSRIRRTRPYLGTMVMHFNIGNSISEFSVSGSFTVSCSSGWDRGGTSNPPANFRLTPVNDSSWGSDGSTQSYPIGTAASNTWNLTEGVYFLRFEVDSHVPKVLTIEVRVT